MNKEPNTCSSKEELVNVITHAPGVLFGIVAIFILAAFITPTPDIMTLCLMALPMILLYECCIWLAWLDRKKQRDHHRDGRRHPADQNIVAFCAVFGDIIAIDIHREDGRV